VVALTLAVVALVGTRAVAADGEGDGSSFGSGQASDTPSEQARPEQAPGEQLRGEQQQPDVAVHLNSSSNDSSGDEVVAGGTPQEPNPIAAEQLQTAAVDARTLLQARSDQLDVRQPPVQAGEEEHGGPGGCTGEGCSKLPLLAAEVPGGRPGDGDESSDPRWDGLNLLAHHDPQSQLHKDVIDVLFEITELDDQIDGISEALDDFAIDGDIDWLAEDMKLLGNLGPTDPYEILGELALRSARLQALEHQAADDPHALAALRRAREISQAARRKLSDLDLPATAVNLDPRVPVYGQVKPGQVPELSGIKATKVPALPGTSAVEVPGLPGTTETRLGDSGVLHAQATRRLPENLDAFVETTAQQAQYMATFAFGGPALVRLAPELRALAPELWAAAVALARYGLGSWLRQPKPVQVPAARPR